jgi:5-hydroxyisourate hydrolase
MTLTTHVLDSTAGDPAAGLAVRWEAYTGDSWVVVAVASTDADGRIADWGLDEEPVTGVHRLTFAVGAYFAARDVETFYPEVSITFQTTEDRAHHHVPLLLSPFGYTTYRGS